MSSLCLDIVCGKLIILVERLFKTVNLWISCHLCFFVRGSRTISRSVKTRIHKLNLKFIRHHTRATYFYWLLIQFRCEKHNKQQRRLISPACGACDKSKAHRYTLTAIKRNPAGPFSFCFSISTQWETRFFPVRLICGWWQSRLWHSVLFAYCD